MKSLKDRYQRSIMLSAAVYFLCGGMAMTYLASLTNGVTYLTNVALLVILFPVLLFNSRRLRKEAEARRLEAARQIGIIEERRRQESVPGTIRGEVIMTGPLISDEDDQDEDDDDEGSVMGHVVVQVLEMTENGEWVPVTRPGPAASVLGHLAEELRNVALRRAASGSDD